MEWIVWLLVVGVLVLTSLFFRERAARLEALNSADAALMDADRLRCELKAGRMPAIRIVLSECSDNELAGLLQTGPDSPVWKGVEECCRRLMDRYVLETEQAGTNESKIAAMDRQAALKDVLVLMRQWHAYWVKSLK